MPSLLNQRDAAFLQAATRMTREHDLLLAITSSGPESAPREQAIASIRSLVERNCDGVIALCPQLDMADREELRGAATNIIYLDVGLDGQADELSAATHQAAGTMAGHILKAKRHDRVAVLTRARASEAIVVNSFLTEFAANRSETEAIPIIEVSTNARLATEISALRASAYPHSALLCTDPQVAAYATECIHEQGANPAGPSILAYDPYFLLESGAIDTIQPSISATTRRAIGMLLNNCYGTQLPPCAESLTVHHSADSIRGRST